MPSLPRNPCMAGDRSFRGRPASHTTTLLRHRPNNSAPLKPAGPPPIMTTSFDVSTMGPSFKMGDSAPRSFGFPCPTIKAAYQKRDHEVTLLSWAGTITGAVFTLAVHVPLRTSVSGLFSASSRPFAYQAYISVYAIYIIPSPDRRFHGSVWKASSKNWPSRASVTARSTP